LQLRRREGGSDRGRLERLAAGAAAAARRRRVGGRVPARVGPVPLQSPRRWLGLGGAERRRDGARRAGGGGGSAARSLGALDPARPTPYSGPGSPKPLLPPTEVPHGQDQLESRRAWRAAGGAGRLRQ